MAAHASELEIAKKNLTDAIGDNIKHYWANLKLWFKQKISKEEFDIEARRLLSQDNVHVHNDFLLAILTRCQIIISTPEGPGSLQWPGGSAAKPCKPKGKKKLSSRQKFDHRFQPQNPLSAAQPFSPREAGPGGEEEEQVRLSAHTLLLPTRGQLEARMMVTAFELGLDNVTEDSVSTMIYAVEHHLKDVLTAVVTRRKAYRLRDGHFPYAFGTEVTPRPYLQNSLAAYQSVSDCPPPSASLPAGPPPQVAPDEAEQQAVLLLACSSDTVPVPLPPISMFDLLEALQVHRGVMPSHTMYALNMERILARLWHPSIEELEQDHVHRQRLAGKEGLLLGS
ncbi:transcriptional adapter 1 isoform X1 [Gadus chalcogrammus]|uniref:transcriptional adapter 1 isoform X1 n=1 Tax=Gadus chalcogrammus TaxID=1042646 RepID=UPI0024C4B4F9|nr:transcriptional adapter 1 isoform X1 [Gadus chalcogrammus]